MASIMLQEIYDFLLKLSSSKKKNPRLDCVECRESSNILEVHKIPKRLLRVDVTRCFELVSNARTRSVN